MSYCFLELSNAWSNDNKMVTVSVYQEEIPIATRIKITINNCKTDNDICDILKHTFYSNYVCIGCILVYYYFGKRLEIEVKDLRSDSIDNNKEWYLLSEKTAWIMQTEEIVAKKKMQCLGGYDNILEEITTYINMIFNDGIMTTSFQRTRGLLLHGHSGIGKTAICKYIIECFSCYHIEVNGSAIFSKYFGETESTTTSLFEKAVQNQPSIIFVDEIETICPRPSANSTEQERRVTSAFVSALDRLHEDNRKVFILATTRKPDSVHPMLRRFGRLDKEIEIPIPDRIRRREILYSQLKDLPNKVSNKLDSIADLAHGYVAADLMNLCSQATMRCIKRSSEYIEHEDLMAALTVVRPSAMRELLIEVPNVRWSDIGGQSELKLKLRQAVEWPLKHADSFRRLGVKPPSGVLLYGPPGCSKTMIAKALATESGLNFLLIKGPELFSKWVGDSERAVRDLFTKARQVAPSIIFFDEMDAIGTERGGNGDSGVHQRVLAQLLTELDGVVPLNSVTILAATNRPDMMDRALLRPGRLDRLIYVPLPDYETRLQILELKLAQMSTSHINTDNLAARTEKFSGAELEALCKEAALKALEIDLNCKYVTMEHFEIVLKDYKPRTPDYLLKIYEEFALGQRA